MKQKMITFAAGALLSLCGSAQSLKECQTVVEIAVESINTKSTAGLKAHLADDFSCLGQKGTIAQMVLEQLVAKLDGKVSDIKLVSREEGEGRLTLIYDFRYSHKPEPQKTTFVFNKKNQVEQLDLLKAGVKVMKVNTKAAVKVPDREVITLPMELHKGLIVVTARLNGAERKFILDSGCPSFYLNSATMSHAGEGRAVQEVRGVNSAVTGMSATRIESFDLGGIRMEQADVLMSDLSHLAGDMEIHGLIGYSVIKDFDWLFDYEGRTFTLLKPDHTPIYIRENGLKTTEVPLQAVSETSHIPYLEAEIHGQHLKLGIDCGATVNLLDTLHLEPLRKQLKKPETTTLVGVSAEKSTITNALLKSLHIGKKKFKNVQTTFSDMAPLNRKWKTKLDGLVGTEILSRQKTLLRMKERKILFVE